MRYILGLAVCLGFLNSFGQNTYPIQWKDYTNVTNNNGVITKTIAAGWNNAGCNAYNELAPGKDGYIEFTVTDLNSIYIIGFGHTDQLFYYWNPVNAWYVNSNNIYFIESGSNNLIENVNSGDILKIERIGNMMYYYHNGVIKRKIPVSNNFSLKPKCIVYSGSAPNANASFDSEISLIPNITNVSVSGTGGSIHVTANGGIAPYSYKWSSGEVTSTIDNKSFGEYTVTVTDATGKKIKATYNPCRVIYVAKGGTGDGSTWALALPDIQSAISLANTISGYKQIWVARGEYFPTSSNDRTASFNLPLNTFIYGGFWGIEGVEISLEQRNYKDNRTLLSGDLGNLFDKTDNSYHVITAQDVDGNSGIDGFIIKQGNANGTTSFNNSGGGILILGNSLTTSPRVKNCEFIDNSADLYGGALVNISNGSTVSPTIVDCFFNGNNSSSGGAVANYRVTSLVNTTLVNCSFSTNHATQSGGAVFNIGGSLNIINSTFSKNNCILKGGAVYNATSGSSASIQNSILWKNFAGLSENGSTFNQFVNDGGTIVVKNNIIQGGFGNSSDQNIDSDPLFVREPSFVGKYPRTSIIPSDDGTNTTVENVMRFSGSKLPGHHTYIAFKDKQYNKLYFSGVYGLMIDLNTLTNGLPTSTLYPELVWGRVQKPEVAIHNASNKVFLASTQNGILTIDRATGVSAVIDPLLGEPITYTKSFIEDIVIDNSNNLLYAPVLYWPDQLFYGLLEYNLTTNTKRWINNSSTPALSTVSQGAAESYWNGHRIFLDEVSNILYFATGKGIWWWNRNNNATGIYNTDGGIPLLPGNPGLPSNLTTSMFIDRETNTFYIGTIKGLFVWNRNTNTSKIYNVSNTGSLINQIVKNEADNLIYVCSELYGCMMTINTVTGEQKLFSSQYGSEVYPQLVDNEVESVYFDNDERKLYASADAPGGGVWINDYGNLIPDYGDLRLQNASPAIDRSNEAVYPTAYVEDINMQERFVNYTSKQGNNSLDLGAYENAYSCLQPVVAFQIENNSGTYLFTPTITNFESGCTIDYHWDFGDGISSIESSPSHIFDSQGSFAVDLNISYTCSNCPTSTITSSQSLTVNKVFCDNIYCNLDGSVSVGTPSTASGYKLSIKGKMIMEGAKVALSSSWPDYVFSNSYCLLNLPALKIYIDKNKHLPNVPSAQTVKSDGIDVGEMSKKLLEKTEELTLYFIELDQRLKKLETRKQ